MHKKGFSLMEIIMAVVIFSVIMLGVVSVFVSGKRIVQHSRARMTAAELGKIFLDLPTDPTSLMYQNEGLPSNAGFTVNMGNYTAQYTINTLTNMTNIYRVKTVINWTESE